MKGEFPTLGYLAGEWIEEHCLIPDGPRMGEPYILTDEMWNHLVWAYRLRDDAHKHDGNDAFVYAGSQLMRPQKWGKDPFMATRVVFHALGPSCFAGWDARGEPVGSEHPSPWICIAATEDKQPLALDTPVPTPSGWTTVGDLRTGDSIFSSDGSVALVESETPVLLGEPCYRVSFSDGEEIVASGSHSWTVEDMTSRGSRKRFITLSTRDLAEKHRRPNGESRFRVGLTRWDLPERHLDVDPYLLGLWLGDGSSRSSTFAFDARVAVEFKDIIEPLLLPTEQITWREYKGNQATFRIRNISRHASSGPSFQERLRQIGVLGGKHIPEQYLRAGTKQRMDLLQGLMDSDGSINKKGFATFTNVNEELLDGVAELLTSLGYRWFKRLHSTAKNAYILNFVPGDEPVFRLSYKYLRQKSPGAHSQSRWRHVVAVDPIQSVPVKCVGISTEDHLFLVGRRAVATHNTDFTYAPVRYTLENGPLSTIPGLDVTLGRATIPGGYIDPVTTSARARLGGRFTFVTLTESGLLVGGDSRTGGVEFARTLKRNVAGMGGMWTEATNAYDPTELSVAQRTMEAKAPDVFVDYRPPRQKVPIDDDEALLREIIYLYGDSAKINGGWVSERRILSEIKRADSGEGHSRRFWLNEITSGTKAVADPATWHTLARPQGHKDYDPLKPGDAVALGFDGSRTRDCTAVHVCRIRDGRLFYGKIWNPANYPDHRIPRSDVDRLVRDMFETYDVHYLFADPFQWDPYLEVWAGEFPKKVVEFRTNEERKFDHAIRRFLTAYRTGELTHDGNELVDEHVFSAVLTKGKKKSAWHQEDPDGAPEHYLRLEKKREGVHYDALVAAILAFEARGQAIEDGALVPEPVQQFFGMWR